MITETDIQKINKLIVELSEGKYQIINSDTGNPVTHPSSTDALAKPTTSSIPQNIPQPTSTGYLFGAQHLIAESKLLKMKFLFIKLTQRITHKGKLPPIINSFMRGLYHTLLPEPKKGRSK